MGKWCIKSRKCGSIKRRKMQKELTNSRQRQNFANDGSGILMFNDRWEKKCRNPHLSIKVSKSKTNLKCIGNSKQMQMQTLLAFAASNKENTRNSHVTCISIRGHTPLFAAVNDEGNGQYFEMHLHFPACCYYRCCASAWTTSDSASLKTEQTRKHIDVPII